MPDINISTNPTKSGDFLLTGSLFGSPGASVLTVFTVPAGFFLRLYAMTIQHNDATAREIVFDFKTGTGALSVFNVSNGPVAQSVPQSFADAVGLLIPPGSVLEARSLGLSAGAVVAATAWGLLLNINEPSPFTIVS